MADLYYTGNAMPAPSVRKGGKVVDQEILDSMHNYYQKGVTLKPGQGVLEAGTLLTRDAATKQYVKGTGANARGILRKTVDTGSSADDQVFQANILYKGIVKLPLVRAANSGVDLDGVLGGRVVEHSAPGSDAHPGGSFIF